MKRARDEPAGAAGLQRGVSMKRDRLRGGDARTEQLQSEIDQEHEPSALDRAPSKRAARKRRGAPNS